MQSAGYYREQASKFRKLAEESDSTTARMLRSLADDYDAEARRLEPEAEPPLPSPD